MVRPNHAFVAACVLFALTRAAMLYWPAQERSVVNEMGQVGLTYRLARERGESFYPLYSRMVQARQEALKSRGGPRPDTTRNVLEYPPLAIALMVVPAYFCDLEGPDPLAQYASAYHAMLWAIDLATFILLAWLIRKMYPDQPARLLIYVIGGAVLWNLIYDRFDLVVALLMLLAIALLLSKAHWSIALAVLAIAVNLKLVPIILAPVFVLRTGAIRDAVVRSCVFIAMCVAIFTPFYLTGGSATLDFLRYHANRGLHIEAVFATPILMFSDNTLALRYGAIEMTTEAAGATANLCTLASIVAVATVALIALRQAMRRRLDDSESVLLCLLILWAAMTASKVFSPQYLLWLIALVPLLPLRRWQMVAFGGGISGRLLSDDDHLSISLLDRHRPPGR